MKKSMSQGRNQKRKLEPKENKCKSIVVQQLKFTT
jgi:hypothetical protein